MRDGILIGYFAKRDEARAVIRQLARHGFRRTVIVYKGMDDHIHCTDRFPGYRALGMLVLACLCGASAALALQLRGWSALLPFWGYFPPSILVCCSATVGALTAFCTLRRNRIGVATEIIGNYSRWLVPGESVLILQAPVELLQRPVALLRENGDTPPALFIVHPKREWLAEATGPRIKLSPEQIIEHSLYHAREQQICFEPHRTAEILKRLKQSRQLVRLVCADLTAASRLEQKATPSADWILDNEYILEKNARDVLLNLPRRFYQQLPTLAADPYQGLPCIYALAMNLVSHAELRLDQENILSFIETYQTVRTLTICELWAIPQMLRIALIENIQNLAIIALADLRERQLAEFWANRLIAANRRDSTHLFAILAELAKAELTPTPYFAAQLVSLLYDEGTVLAPVQNWLERALKSPLHEVTLREQNRQTREQISCGNAFTSLRLLALLDWRELFEQLSRVERLLRCDPCGVYPHMDFATRDRCRRAIEELAVASGQSEEQVAERVIMLATQAAHMTPPDERRTHVGAWLSGEGRAELVTLLSCRESLRYRTLEMIYRYHAPLYVSGIVATATLFMIMIALFGHTGPPPLIRIGLLLLLLIPVSQLAIEIINYLVLRLLPPRPLPKMDFETCGIPDEFRTLVVVPMMLVNSETVRSEVEKLEIRFLANKEENLFFSLFTDYIDCDERTHSTDNELLNGAIESIAELNRCHGSERFFLFHRERTWSESEQKFIGWERKRGKLEELNRLIDGTRPEAAPRLVYVGDPLRLADVRFVITLDSDTQLPHATARRMVETLAHPLNQPRFDASGAIVAGTYTLIQPRVSPTLQSTTASTFSRLFADAVGIDPYSQAVSDVYQDLSGEGSYHGKGIYDVRAFSRVLSGQFPEEWVLSHDLIEGAHVRVGLASDIELYDEFPQGYQSYSRRTHRWIRGDWQIAGWLFPNVPHASGIKRANPLSLFNRWKILDNLRRSLLPATSLALLITSWFISAKVGTISSLVVCTQLLFHPLAQPFTMATTRKGLKYFSPAKLLHDLMRATVDAALLPHQTVVTLDAIIRVCYRRLISRHNLLEWTAQANHWSTSRRQTLFITSLTLGSIFSIGTGGLIWFTAPTSLLQATPWLMLWLISPLLGWLLNLRPAEQPTHPLSEADRHFLRHIARRTWRYFSTFVTADSCWLPPDNYQVVHQERLAMRTSPTNIGLWMTSVLAAHDCGYLTIGQVITLLTNTMTSLNRLELHKGHLLNWYDIQTLAPLEPRYVSTVDSGNLLGALWTVEQGLLELITTPLLNDRLFSGLTDTGEILTQSSGKEHSDARQFAIETLLKKVAKPPTSAIGLLQLQRRITDAVSDVVSATQDEPWGAELAQQVAAWQHHSSHFLCWIDILAEKPFEELILLGPAALLAIRKDLQQAPSLSELALNQVISINLLKEIRGNSSPHCASLIPWLDRLLTAFSAAQWAAGEVLAQADCLLTNIQQLSAGMNMHFLYEKKRKLFSIGFNVSVDMLDTSSYDLLASEARLGSFIAIARGDVPMEHWFSLGRPYGAIHRERVLLSWTGTMFEYLMPLLFQRTYTSSLLDKAAREAVAIQIGYGQKCNVPWGISESAFADLDREKTYQYKAFGVSVLGLKRGLEEQLVIAPYATMLALNISPDKSIKNLKKLQELGLLSEYGFYEAMDFSRQVQREGKRGIIIGAYMAHHQGMAFIALTNFLHGNPFPRRFHHDPRVKAFEALLQERIPTLPPLQLVSTRQSRPTAADDDLVTPSSIIFTTPDTVTPRTLLLSNGRYGVMITNSGSGYSQWMGQELTRWCSDQTSDEYGTFCYIHESDQERLWSNAYHPVCGTAKEYSVSFSLDRALFRRVDFGIHCETEVVVSPEDDVEIRRITLINRSTRIRHLEITSYVELSMAPHNADRQHPAFNKLFIQTEAVAEQKAVLAHRRGRSTTETPLYVAHCMTLDATLSENISHEEFRFETDRGRFIGRGRSMSNPMGATKEPGNSQGFVLDPMLGIRRTVMLRPGQHCRMSLIVAAGHTRDQIMLLMNKYGDYHATERAMDFAWGSAQQQLQMLHIQPDEARRFQQLASHLLFPNNLLRATGERLVENNKGQASLWAYGISGDLPIALVSIGDERDISLIRQMLQAYIYWRLRGFSSDLVILNEEAGGYDQPLQERLERLIQTHSLFNGTNQPGGIFLKKTSQIKELDIVLLKAVACIVLVAARGTLPQQLGAPAEVPLLLEKLPRKRLPRDASPPLPFMELHYFNSLGGFTPDGREYAIYLGPDTNTPAPWVNIIANPNFGTMVSESGSGFTWYGNSQRNRLSGWSNDPVLDPATETIYIRDEETGTFWTPTARPIREEAAYRARHGAGYSVFEHNSNGINQELTIMVPVDDNGGEAIKLQRLRLTNTSPRKRTLSVTYYVELTIGEHREASQMHVSTNWEDESSTLMARNRYHPEYGQRVVYLSITPAAESFSGDRTAFIGRNHSLSNPVAMEQTRLSGRTGAGLDPCAALRISFELAPGQQQDILCLFGQAESVYEARRVVQMYQDGQAFEQSLLKTIAWWNRLLGTVQIHTPELATDLMMNRWLQYQSLSCRIWGRSAFYQSGGAFGFRDQLQDVMAFLYVKPELARSQIILAASRQFREGDVQHWWHPPTGAGIRSRISDDLLWLPYVVAQYVRTTGDLTLLQEEVSFLSAPPLADNQPELFLLPEVTFERATIFEHCQRATLYGLTSGPHGLPLIGTGDWNDGMNLVGAEGKGESVWLGWFLCELLQGMSELSSLLQKPELAQSYRDDRYALIQRIEQAGWDGEWYLRGTFDDGSPLGSSKNQEARIDSLPQSWACLSGAADPVRAAQALESAWHHLVHEAEGVVLLFEPPFNNSLPSPGYINGYPPGVRENGGQYTHAAIWMAMAMARTGDGTRAAQLLRILNPIEHSRDAAAAWHYRVEPYVVAADIYQLPGRVGQGGWSWYTGSSAWMYRAWLEEVLGLKLRGEQLQIQPVIPATWPGFSINYRHGEALYEILVDNPDGCEQGIAWMELDGRRLDDAVITLERGLMNHQLRVRMGHEGAKDS